MIEIIDDPFENAKFSVRCDRCKCAVSFTLDDVTVERWSSDDSCGTRYWIPCPGSWCVKEQEAPKILLPADFITKLRSTAISKTPQSTRDINYDL